MPTYQYACTACGHQLEAVQTFADDPLTECPACEGRLRKLFSGIGVVFKGSGFYRTDSRAAASSSASSSSSAASAEGGKKSEGAKKPESTTSESAKKPAESKPAASSSSSPAA